MDLRKKKVLVFGWGISGIGATRLLEQQGADVILYDGKETLTRKNCIIKSVRTVKRRLFWEN